MRYPRFPFATLTLFLLVALPYFLFSEGTLYLPTEFLNSLALSAGQYAGLVTHLFLHVGILHLSGNLIPLLLFSLLLESVLVSLDVLIIFFASGILGGALFSLLNPAAYLIGASAAVSGLMSACTALRPKQALVLLVATPILISFVVYPVVSFAERSSEQSLTEKQSALQSDLIKLVAENKTVEAAQVNASLKIVEKQAAQTLEGRQREEATPTDFLVHAFGALVGVAFLFFFRKKKLAEGIGEFESLGGELFAFFERVKRRI
jgi:membrane associated rhomboid family serine protease